MTGESWKRPAVLAACAIVPIALVVVWLAFGGSDDDGPATSGSPQATSVPAGGAEPGSTAGSRPGPSEEALDRGLASMAERQRTLAAEQAAAARRERREAGAFEDELAEAEASLGEDPSEASGPTPEQVEELKRLAAASTPPPEVLQALMDDQPPPPSPEEVEELRRRTAELLDFPEEMVREIKEKSEAQQPSPERMEILRERLRLERIARGQDPETGQLP